MYGRCATSTQIQAFGDCIPLLLHVNRITNVLNMQWGRPNFKTMASERQKLIKSIDATFSKIVRYKHADDNGYASCVTCGKTIQVWWHDGEKIRWAKGCEAGHYIKRGVWPLRWYDRNVHPQCTRCNHFLSGNESAYGKYILKRYGENEFNQLHEEADNWREASGNKTYYIDELREIDAKLKAELKELVK